MADTPINPPQPPRSRRPFLGYILAGTASAAVAVILTIVVTGHVLFQKQGADLREEIPRMQSVIDFQSVSSWVMGCMGVASYKVLPLWHQELLSYYRPDDAKADKLPDSVRDLFNEERAIL